MCVNTVIFLDNWTLIYDKGLGSKGVDIYDGQS